MVQRPDSEAPGPPADRAGDRPSVSGRSIAKNLSWAGASHLASQGTWFASLFVLATLVPPSAFGVVAAAMVIVNLGQLLVGSSTAGDLVVTDELSTGRIRSALLLTFGFGLVVTVATALLAEPVVRLSTGAEAGVLRGLMLSLGMQAVAIVPLALLQRHLRFRAMAVATGGGAVAASILAVIAAAFGAGVWALVVRQVAASAIQVTVAWIAARDLMPSASELLRRKGGAARLAPLGGGWFLYFAFVTFLAIQIDYVVVGRLLPAADLGRYSLAFTLGFAPLTQFSWQVGRVLFPAAAATPTLEEVGRRTLTTLRLCATVLLPLVPVVVVLAPWLIPGVLGARWAGLVAPLQILFAVGAAHGVLNMIGESLTATGNISLHAKLQTVWVVGILPLLIVLVDSDGIRGAAIAHAVILVPLVFGYGVLGARKLDLRAADVVRAVQGVVAAVALQAVATFAVAAGLEAAGASIAISASAGAVTGIAVVLMALALLPSRPLQQLRGFGGVRG